MPSTAITHRDGDKVGAEWLSRRAGGGSAPAHGSLHQPHSTDTRPQADLVVLFGSFMWWVGVLPPRSTLGWRGSPTMREAQQDPLTLLRAAVQSGGAGIPSSIMAQVCAWPPLLLFSCPARHSMTPVGTWHRVPVGVPFQGLGCHQGAMLFLLHCYLPRLWEVSAALLCRFLNSPPGALLGTAREEVQCQSRGAMGRGCCVCQPSRWHGGSLHLPACLPELHPRPQCCGTLRWTPAEGVSRVMWGEHVLGAPSVPLGGILKGRSRAEPLGMDRAPHCPRVGVCGSPPSFVPGPFLTSLSTEKHPEHSWCGRRRPPPRVPACRGKESAPHGDPSGGTAGPSEQWDNHGVR